MDSTWLKFHFQVRPRDRAERNLLPRAAIGFDNHDSRFRPSRGFHPAEPALEEPLTVDAIAHDAVTVTSQYEDFYRQETGWSGLLYKCANARYEHKLAKLDLPTACDMRAPS